MKRYIRCNSFNGYLYIFKHGTGPGTIPKDVAIIKEKSLPNGYTAVWLDRFLSSYELKTYDIPSETQINKYLGWINYCQKGGDVVPCDEDIVRACGSINASTNLPTFREFATTEWELLNDGSKRLKLKDLFVYFGTDKQWNASNPGYWYEIKVGDKTYKESKKYLVKNKERCYKAMQNDVSELLQSDDIESCETVTAAKSAKVDILDKYVGKDIWLKAKLSQKAYFRRGYTGNEYWIRIVDKDEDGNYIINRVNSYKEYKGNSAQKQKTLSNTYTVDKNSVTLFNPIQTVTTDEIFNVAACDKVSASTVPTSDIKFLAKEALNCNTRDELAAVIDSLQSIDKKLYLHYMELLRDDSLSVAYIASQLSDELMCYYVDDVDACSDVKASDYRYSAGRIEDDGTEDFYYDTGFNSYDEACDWGINHGCTHIYDREKDEFTPINSCDTKYFANMVNASNDPDSYHYLVRGYYDQDRRGLADDSWANTLSEADEIINEYANQGYYIELRNLKTGTILEFSADNWFDEIYPDGGFAEIGDI